MRFERRLIPEASPASGGAVDLGSLFAEWHEYAAMPHLADYDALSGDELSVPIIYEP